MKKNILFFVLSLIFTSYILYETYAFKEDTLGAFLVLVFIAIPITGVLAVRLFIDLVKYLKLKFGKTIINNLIVSILALIVLFIVFLFYYNNFINR